MHDSTHLIDHLPASKRAARDIHIGVDNARSGITALRDKIAALQAEVTSLSEQLNALQSGYTLADLTDAIRRQNELLERQESHTQVMLWAGLRHQGEGESAMKRRIFSNMLTATGNLRLLQLGCTQLLREFDTLCRRHSITYWAEFGTLLGAVRHKGFIPWDDDTDLGMMRDQIRKLITVINDDADYRKRYKVSLVYDPYAYCRQIRFMYNDPHNPSFLDLFIYDYSSGDDRTQYGKRTRLREDLIKALEQLPYFSQWREHGYLRQGEEHAEEIEAVFERYWQEAETEGIICPKIEGQKILFSMDNCTLDDYLRIYDMSDILPVTELSFENITIAAPRHYQDILQRDYGDIYRLPDDIVSHFDHVSHDLFKDPAVIKAMRTSVDNPEEYLA